MGTIEFRLLGTIEAWYDGAPVDLGGSKPRCLLAALLLEANKVLPTERLVDIVWDDAPPATAHDLIANYVHRLRTALRRAGGDGGSHLLTQGSGYLMRIDPDTVDVHRFRRIADQAGVLAGAGQHEAAAPLLRAALALWRQELPLANAASRWLALHVVPTLEAARLDAEEQLAECELRGGHDAAQVVDRLRGLAPRHPDRERLTALLMDALHQAGRRTEALEAYTRARTRMVDELGLEPTRTLTDAHRRILDDQPAYPIARKRVPRQLPPDVAAFTGRQAELTELDRMFATMRAGGSAVVISTVSGTAGVGKTALVTHWAHASHERFPDGHLYIDLRGYDPDQPVTPHHALDGFLRSLGIDAPGVPQEEADRVALYRTLLDDRRMLVVLDNAHSVEQVRPLLPGTSSCFVVVTSRDRLPGLVARHGARRIDLDLLPTADAVALLTALVGPRVVAEPSAAAELVEHCARLPLALRVAAELVADRPDATVAELVAELADERSRLDLLDAGGDERTAVRAVFSWSYRHLPEDAALAFRLLGLHPGRDLDLRALAALAGIEPARARRMLDVLVRAHLVEPAGTGRYQMHDLLRAYAAEMSTVDGSADRAAALTRLFDYYVHTVQVAMERYAPHERHRLPEVPESPTPAPDLADRPQALAWLEAERGNLLAVAEHSAAHGWTEHTRWLSQLLFRYLDTMLHHTEAQVLHAEALRVSRAAGDRPGEGQALNNLAVVHLRLGHYGEALEEAEQSLVLLRGCGDLVGQARALGNLGSIHLRAGRHDEAIECLRAQVHLAREVGDREAESYALGSLGAVYARIGRYGEAVDHLDSQRRICAELDDRSGECTALVNLGYAHLMMRRYREALGPQQHALALVRETGLLGHEGYVLCNLGVIHQRLGQPELAMDYLRQSLTLAGQLADRPLECAALNDLGQTLRALGLLDDALVQHGAALKVAEDIEDRYEHARALDGYAHTYRDLGDLERARKNWQAALQMFSALATPEAADVRSHLSDGESPTCCPTEPH